LLKGQLFGSLWNDFRATGTYLEQLLADIQNGDPDLAEAIEQWVADPSLLLKFIGQSQFALIQDPQESDRNYRLRCSLYYCACENLSRMRYVMVTFHLAQGTLNSTHRFVGTAFNHLVFALGL